MSRAFVKEDTDVPERSARTRSASGLPPGAINYITASGACRLQQLLEKLRGGASDNSAELARLEDILASVTVIETPAEWPASVALGAKVTVRYADGQLETHHIVGVDEVEFEERAVSWISPLGKALLGAEVGERVRVEGEKRSMTIVKIDYGEFAE
jgi:transcription elongation factor GreB